MHRVLSVILVLVCVVGVCGASRSPLSLAGGDAVSVGIYIAPVAPGSSPVVECESARLLAPASILKSLTSATALSILGPDYRWRTDVMTVGRIDDNGVLEGDVVIRGTGDPTVDSRFSRKITAFVKKSWLRCVMPEYVLSQDASESMTAALSVQVSIRHGKWRMSAGITVPAYILSIIWTMLLP